VRLRTSFTPRESEQKPREPMYSIPDFAEKKKLDYPALLNAINRSGDKPEVACSTLKRCSTGPSGPSIARLKNMYRLSDLEAWLARYPKPIRPRE
jgi:hypothetical protein